MVKHIFTSVDIGTDTIKVVVAELYKGKLNLLAASSVKSKGIKKGLICDFDEALGSLKSAIYEAEEMLDITIKKVIINVPSYFTNFSKVDGKININNSDSVITGNDITDVIQNSVMGVNTEQEVISVIPIDFSVDDEIGIKDPKGIIGSILSARSILVTVPKKNIYSIASLAAKAGLEIIDVSIGGIGDINSFKNKDIESKIGAVINIGADTTNVSIYNKGIIIKNSVIGMGGRNIDSDIAYVYKISSGEAKRIKEKFAFAHKKYANINEIYETSNKKISQLEVSEVVMSRLEQILSLAKKEISDIAGRRMDYVIITGGTSNMTDFDIIASDIFGKDVIIGNVMVTGIRNNKYSVCLGNIVYFINKLKLKGKSYTMVEEEDMSNFSLSQRKLINISNESMLGKVFGYFFGEANEEDK